jgi:pimeloyl-ACP methyl ester carboxylesterase
MIGRKVTGVALVAGLFAAGTVAAARAAGVSDLKAVHRQGQTFLTWNETDSPAREEALTVAVYKALMKEWTPKVAYRIYRSDKPISSSQGLQPVGEAGPLSCWNGAFPVDGPNPKDTDPMVRFVTADGAAPLAPATGLYVHNPATAGKAYYAVAIVRGGTPEKEIAALKDPVAETPGQGTPVLQKVQELTGKEHFNFVEGPTLRTYIRWEAPPHANRENVANEILVAVPKNLPNIATLGLHLHGWGGSPRGGYGWWFNAEKGAILIAPNQVPYDWWTGYHELYGKGERSQKEWSKGVVHPYTQKRLLSLVEWAATQWTIDKSRTFVAGNSMGGSGAPMLAIRHPGVFAWAVGWVGVHVPQQSPHFKNSYAYVYGDPEWGVKFEDGMPVWDYFNDDWYLRNHVAQDTPFLTWSNGKNDAGIGWAQAVTFYKAMQETRRPHMFAWGQNGHIQRAVMPVSLEQRVMPLDLRVDQSQPAFTKCSLDGNPGNGDPEDGDKEGGVNLYLSWETKDIVDTAAAWEMTIGLIARAPKDECTVDLTPRRLQQFKVKAGETLKWTSTSGGKEVQSGSVTADKYGLVTIEGIKVTKAGVRVRMTPVKPGVGGARAPTPTAQSEGMRHD